MAQNEGASTGLCLSSASPHDKAAGGGEASMCGDEQHPSASALLAGSERVQQARLNTEHLLSMVSGTEQVMEQTEHLPPLGDKGAGTESASEAMPGLSVDTGERAVSKGAALSLSSSQSGQHLLISAHVGEPSSLSGHAVSVDSDESAGKRECVDASWPAGTAQHIIAASKVGNVRCNELRSSGGSVGSCRTSSDLSNSQHDSYQGSYPSRPESSGTQGTLDHLSRWQISVIH